MKTAVTLLLTGLSLLAILLLLAFVAFLLIVIAEKIRKMLLRPGTDSRIGDYFYQKGKAETRLRIFGHAGVFAEFPVSSDGKIEEAVVDILLQLQDSNEKLKKSLGEKAIAEFKQISHGEDGAEDEFSQAVHEMKALVDNPIAFIEKFAVISLCFFSAEKEIRIEFCPPWDPEHTYCAVLNYSLQLIKFGLTCAM